MRKVAALFVVAAMVAVTGCHHAGRPADLPPPDLKMAPTFSQYHLESFSWTSVARVLVLPLLNESKYTRADEEIGRALRTELQSLGRFEVVGAPVDSLARLSAGIHRNGKFNEAEMFEIVRETHADIVVFGTITQYTPYPRPRLGLVVQAVSPHEAKVIGSVDGVWDTTRFDVASRIRQYYRMRPHTHPWVVNHTIFEDDSYSGDIPFDSPQLFQRFVCAEAVLNLVKDTAFRPADCAPCANKKWLSSSPKNMPGW